MRHLFEKCSVLVALILGLTLIVLPTARVLGQPSAPELHVAFSVGPQTLEPRVGQGTPAQSVLRMIYEPLLSHDRNGKLLPVLAQSWQWISPTILELKLRQNVKFTNGEPFTSESVKYTIDSIIAPDSKFPVNRDRLADIVRVDTPDPYTVHLVTQHLSRPLLFALTFWPLGMMPPKASAELGPRLAAQPIGTGPYKLVQFTPGQTVVLEANPAYWGKKPAYSRIVYNIIPEDGTRIAALESGQVMMINNVPPDQVARLKANPQLSVASAPAARPMFLDFRMAKPIVKDVRFRQAVSLAINRRAIVNDILGGMTKVAVSPLPPMVWGAVALPEPEYSPSKAKALLKQAGYQGEPFELFATNGRFILDKQIAEAVGGYLQAAGINVKLHVQEPGQIINEWFHGSTWDGLLYGWGITTFDPDELFAPMVHSAFSPGKYHNADVDALIDAAKATTDETKALQYYAAIQHIVWTDLPLIFLYDEPQIYAVNKRLRGYAPLPDEFMYFTKTSLQAK